MEFTKEIGARICQLIAADYTVDDISKQIGISNTTLYDWIRENQEFSSHIARARESQADAIADKIHTIAAKVENGELLPEQGKVAAGLRQWLAAKRKPKVYGDKVTLAGDAENPLFNLGKRMDALRQRREARQLPAPVIDITPVKVDNTAHPGEQFA